MSAAHAFHTGSGNGNRRSHFPPTSGPKLRVQSTEAPLPHYPFQPLPQPNGVPPFRFDLAQLLSASDISRIQSANVMVCHTVGDTGDYRGQQQDFVSAMMTYDANTLPNAQKPAFFYHLGDVVYFAGDVDKYGDNFYETYKDYPAFIVAIPGNHDCQPDDPQDGPVDPNKKPLDGWVLNFMSPDPSIMGSAKTASERTRMDLPNVYWTFTTPFATFIGLFSNVGETEGEIHQDQIDWFRGELTAADRNRSLIVSVHHPPFSGDTEHSGSTAVHGVLFDSFQATGRYPDLILSGHVHNYQRFTNTVQTPQGSAQITCAVAGAGGYTKLGKLPKINGDYPDPDVALTVEPGLTLERYDQDNFGFLRLELSADQILGTYLSAPYAPTSSPVGGVTDRFAINRVTRTVTTLSTRAGI